MDWRNGVLILCFVIFTPYAWEYLTAFFAGVIPAEWLSTALFGTSGSHVNAIVVIDNIVYSLFACAIIAMPLGAITNRYYMRNATLYAGFSTLHLVVVFAAEHIHSSTLYFPLAAVEAVAFSIWLFLATLVGAVARNAYLRRQMT